jgi:hypothetical protein
MVRSPDVPVAFLAVRVAVTVARFMLSNEEAIIMVVPPSIFCGPARPPR